MTDSPRKVIGVDWNNRNYMKGLLVKHKFNCLQLNIFRRLLNLDNVLAYLRFPLSRP